MTGDRISITEIRKHPSGETSAQGEWRWSEDVILALVEAVEAAQVLYDDGPTASGSERSAIYERMAEALARFDFGEET